MERLRAPAQLYCKVSVGWLSLLSLFLLPIAVYPQTKTVMVGSGGGPPGLTVAIPITVDSADNIAGFQFALQFDPRVVAVADVLLGSLVSGKSEWVLNWNIPSSTPNELRVLAYSNPPTPLTGSGELIKVNFQVSSQASPGTQVNLTLSQIVLADGSPQPQSLPATGVAGTLTVSPPPRVQILTGPLVVNVASYRATVNWITDVPSSSIVTYRPEAGGSSITVTGPDNVTQHSVVLKGLSSATKYLFTVTSSVPNYLPVTSVERSFQTLPPTEVAVGDLTISPGRTALVQVTITQTTGVNLAQARLTLQRDPNNLGQDVVLTGVALGSLAPPGTPLNFTPDPIPAEGTNSLKAWWQLPNGQSLSGVGSILVFSLKVPEGSALGDRFTLSLSEVRLSDETGTDMPIVLRSGTLTVAAILGDADGNGRFEALDMVQYIKAYLGLIPVTDQILLSGDIRPRPGVGGRSQGDGRLGADDLNSLFRILLNLE